MSATVASIGGRRAWRLHAATALTGVFSCLLLVRLILATPDSGDYALRGAVSGDNAGPALLALSHGNLDAFVARQPLMGLLSLLMRAVPTVLALGHGAGDLAAYRVGALACLLPAVALLTWIAADAAAAAPRQRRWWTLASSLAAAAVVFAGPAMTSALVCGHPEDPLAATLAVAAVILACRRRPSWSGVVLGLAIGTKQWATVAALPVLVALPEHRQQVRSVLIAAAVAGPLTLAVPLIDRAAFSGAAAKAVNGTHLTNPYSAWWPFGSHVWGPGGFVRALPLALTKAPALSAALLAGVVVVGAFAWIAHERGNPIDPLALLALLGLCRCLADPVPIEYYYVALVVPLCCWEIVSLRRLPVLALLVCGALSLMFGSGASLPPALLSAVSLAGAVSLALYIARRGWGPFRGAAGWPIPSV